jgi:ribosomal protein L16/L10AE
MVSQVTRGALEDDPGLFSDAYEKALRTLETRQVSSETMETVDARVQRYVKHDPAFWTLIISVDLLRRHGLKYKIISQRLSFELGRT